MTPDLTAVLLGQSAFIYIIRRLARLCHIRHSVCLCAVVLIAKRFPTVPARSTVEAAFKPPLRGLQKFNVPTDPLRWLTHSRLRTIIGNRRAKNAFHLITPYAYEKMS